MPTIAIPTDTFAIFAFSILAGIALALTALILIDGFGSEEQREWAAAHFMIFIRAGIALGMNYGAYLYFRQF